MRLEYSSRHLPCVWVYQECATSLYITGSIHFIIDEVVPRRTADCVSNVMAHAQKPDFVFRRNVRVHLNRRVFQFSRLLATEVCASAVVMLDTACFEVVWKVLVTHSIRQFPLHLLARMSPCAITFQLDSTVYCAVKEESKYTFNMKNGSKRMIFPSIKMTALITSMMAVRC